MAKNEKTDETEVKKICGLVMPISAIDGCSEAHWSEVHEILSDSAEDAGFEANLVSNADDTGIIQKRILLNLYDNPIVVCDVSGKNPNVMFELGLRLAFDKPTIIVKDDKTSYSFDTSPIEHLVYPRDLRFSQIVEFKQKLTEKIIATYEKSVSDKDYTTFLKNFGEFTVAKLDKKEVSGQEYIIEELRSLRQMILTRPVHSIGDAETAARPSSADLNFCLTRRSTDESLALRDLALKKSGGTRSQVWRREWSSSSSSATEYERCRPKSNCKGVGPSWRYAPKHALPHGRWRA